MTAVGIDVAAARPCTTVVIRKSACSDWLDTEDVEELTAWIVDQSPDVVAVDAPCAVSRGLLRMPADGGKPYRGRVCDRELRRRGIPVYEVPDTRDSAPSWMKVGFRLYDALREAGYNLPTTVGVPASLIEVYPYASFVTLLGRMPARKSSPLGRRERADLLELHGLHDMERADHDALDALAAALTGLKYLEGHACALGDPREALVWLPVDRAMGAYTPASNRGSRLQLLKLEHLRGSTIRPQGPKDTCSWR